MHSIVKVIRETNFAIQESILCPSDLSGPLLVDQQPASQLLGLDLEETGQLGQVHCRVQTEVGLDSWVPHVGLDLIHEDGQVVLQRIDVELWVIEVGGSGRDEFGAGRTEQLLVDREGVWASALQLQELIAILLTESRVDSLVESGGVESHADGDKSVHLVVLLGIVRSVLLEVLGSRDVDEDVAEHAHGICVTAHHHVGESHVVVGREMGGHNTSKHSLLVQLNIIESLQGQTEISQQAMNSQETNDGEVSEHAVKRLRSVISCNSHGLLIALHRRQLLVDL